MAKFFLYTCNNLPALAELFLHFRRKHSNEFRSENIFISEEITVPTRGISIWLEQFLVKNNEIIANIDFQYTLGKIEQILDFYFSDDKSYMPELFTVDVMSWRIMKILRHDSSPEFDQLKDYLSKSSSDGINSSPEASDINLYELSRQVAEVFNAYMIYKPEMLSRPELLDEKQRLDESDWQAALWEKLCQHDGKKISSPAHKIVDFLTTENFPNIKEHLVPQTVFGVSTMSPVFLKVFKKLAKFSIVHFFYLNPCDEFWADQKSGRSILKSSEPVDLDKKFENTLLGDFGIQGREFFKSILDLDGVYEYEWNYADEQTLSADQEESTGLLACIQKSVRSRYTPENVIISPDDDSLSLHSCHHELRQVEILHDHLLALLQSGKYSYNDIIVMAPDIAEFAPAIQAVFDQGPLRKHYSIADRSVKHANGLAEAFLDILNGANSRYEVSKIIKLLDSIALRKKSRFSDESVLTLKEWIVDGRIHWGANKEQREELFEVEFDNFSWKQGLARLLLGLAIDADEESIELDENGIVPITKADSQENMFLLGNMCEFVKKLQVFAEKASADKTIAEWEILLNELLQDFFQLDSETVFDYKSMQDCINELCETIRKSEFSSEPMSYLLISAALNSSLERAAPFSPFLNGKITFCSMVPMRGIPSKLIAILGLDEGAFPRIQAMPGFNLIADYLESPFVSRQFEDRYLFLEAILAAQEKLIFYYKGQDEHRIREYLPSTVLNEVMDYIAKIIDKKNSVDELIVKHGLQNFDAEYFGEEKIKENGFLRKKFSYNYAASKIAETLTQEELNKDKEEKNYKRRRTYQMQNFPLEEIEEFSKDEINISLKGLEKFFINPSQFFLERRFNFPYDEWESAGYSDYEPFTVEQLEKVGHIRNLSRIIASEPAKPSLENNEKVKSFYRNLLNKNQLPIAELGKATFSDLIDNAWIPDEDLRTRWSNQLEQEFELELPNVADCLNLEDLADEFPEIILDLNDDYLKDFYTQTKTFKINLSGKLEAAPDQTSLLEFCFSSLSGRHLIRTYLRYLFLAASGGGSAGAMLIGSSELAEIEAISPDDAKAQLSLLLNCYLLGNKRALPLFAGFSTEYMLKGRKLNDAKKKFRPDSRSYGADAENPYVKFLWGDDPDKLPDLALALAAICYKPLVKVKKELE